MELGREREGGIYATSTSFFPTPTFYFSFVFRKSKCCGVTSVTHPNPSMNPHKLKSYVPLKHGKSNVHPTLTSGMLQGNLHIVHGGIRDSESMLLIF